MVPVIERPQHKSTRSVPAASEAMEYPSWTRDDENENEAPRAGLRRDTRYSLSRSSQRRDLPRTAREKEKRGEDLSSDSDSESGGQGKSEKKKSAPPRQLDERPDTTDVPPPDAVATPSAPAQQQLPWSMRMTPRLPTIRTDLEPAATPEISNGDILRPVYVPPERPKSSKTPKCWPPLASASQPLEEPAPVITAPPLPGLESGARKGLDSLPRTEAPIVTVTESSSSAATPALPDRVGKARTEAAREEHEFEGNLHSKTEDALIAVGSVGATIIVFFVCWLVWRFIKIQKRKRDGNFSGGEPTLVPSLDRPKQVMVGIASRIPVLKERVVKRSWATLDKPFDETYWEKTFPASNESPQGGGKGIHVHTAITTRSDPEGQADPSLPGQTPQQAHFKMSTRSRYQMSRISDISSLSSGFGDGDIVMLPAHSTATTITAEYLAIPSPVAQRASVSEASQRRETVFTEASEDPLPRFRTINSWVRQQSGRIKRANQRDLVDSDAPPVPSMPLEQDFMLMMPDEEEPRRVEEAGPGRADYSRDT